MMKILREIRKLINNNRLYSWMAIFIIFVQAYTILGYAHKPVLGKESALSGEEFRLQLEEKRRTLQDILQKDPQLALGLGYLSLFILAVLITGLVFFIDYLIKKRDNIETIPRTLDLPPPLWGLGDVLEIIVLFIFFSHFFFIFAHILSQITSSEAVDKRASMVASTGFMDILLFLFILRLVTVKHGQSIKALGISIQALLRNIAAALYSYIGFLPVLAVIFFGVVGIARVLNYTPPPEPIYELIFEEKRLLLLAAISVLVSAIGPAVEEVFFRGFLYGALKIKFGIPRAIFFSAFLFSFIHTNVLGFIPILVLGVFLAYLREKTGSLIPCITVHMVHNSALTALMFLARVITSRA